MTKISLTASMRSNLLSLQNISKQVSSTQNNLATGNKVNSAIDNPSSYYTAQSLNNRAKDLDALLDSMGQAVSAIKAATTALEAGANFLEQATAVATQALETNPIPTKSWFESQENVAAVVSNWDELKAALDSGKTGDIVVYGNIIAEDAITLGAGQNLVGVGYYGVNEPEVDKFSQLNFNLEELGITSAIKTTADNLTLADISVKAVMAKSQSSRIINLNNTGNHVLHNLDLMMDNSDQDIYVSGGPVASYGISGIKDVTFTGTNNIYESSNNKHVLSYGIASSKDSQLNVYGKLNIFMQQNLSRAISRVTLNTYGNAELNFIADERVLESTILNAYDNSRINLSSTDYTGTKSGTGIAYGEVHLYDNVQLNIYALRSFYSYDSNNTSYPIDINIESSNVLINTDTTTLFVNNNQLLNFDAVSGFQLGLNGTLYQTTSPIHSNSLQNNILPAEFMEIGTISKPDKLDWLASKNADRTLDYSYKQNSFADSGNKNNSYNSILEQYNSLIKDASYKGSNLLQGDKLNVKFNEKGTSQLNVTGQDMSAANLGLKTTDWQTQGDIAQSLKEISAALKSIRSFSAELGNNYSIITNRQDFTDNLINILTEGADKLTLADMNEESANMLALQTRQQLAINSLSLASQASQAVLKLF